MPRRPREQGVRSEVIAVNMFIMLQRELLCHPSAIGHAMVTLGKHCNRNQQHRPIISRAQSMVKRTSCSTPFGLLQGCPYPVGPCGVVLRPCIIRLLFAIFIHLSPSRVPEQRGGTCRCLKHDWNVNRRPHAMARMFR